MPSLTVGSIELDLLIDAEIEISGDSVFAKASRAEWTAEAAADDNGIFMVPVRPLLIREPGCITLVDTGFGNIGAAKDDEAITGQTLTELEGLGVAGEDINRVILTHAHGDHYQGNMILADGEEVPAFPNAEFVIQKIEAAAARNDLADDWKRYFEPLEEAGKLRLIEGDTEISDSVFCTPTPGHTVGHQSVIVTSGSDYACYLGDLALHILNLKRPEWGADWAWSRDQDRENRSRIVKWANETGGTLILPHDGEHPFVIVDEKMYVLPAQD